MCKVLMVVTCQVNSLPHDAVVYQNNTEPKCFVFISPMPYFLKFKENTEITEKHNKHKFLLCVSVLTRAHEP